VEIPDTRYADSGGIKIAYQVFGTGPFDLVIVPGFVSNLDVQWADAEMSRFSRRLAAFARVIMYDKAGTGLSDPVPVVPTLEQRMRDLLAVVDAADVEQAFFLGISEGGPLSIYFAASTPARVRGLMLYGSMACGLPDAAANPGGPRWLDLVARMKTAVDNWGSGFLLDVFSPTLAGQPMARRLNGAAERAMASPAMARAAYDAVLATDIRDVLPSITTPTLLLHRIGDVMPIEGVRYIAEQIEGATLIELPGADHYWWVGDSEPLLDAIEEFVTGTSVAKIEDRILSTVLFTDIVESTAKANELGDLAWSKLLEEHNRRTRNCIASDMGREVVSTGDGFLATFDGPARAIRCARAVIDSISDLKITIRAGVHTGECQLLSDNIGGIAVHIGARILAHAGPNGIVVSRTVRDLVAGSGIEFEELGEFELKGIPDPLSLYQVSAVPTAHDGRREPMPAGVAPLVHQPPSPVQRVTIALAKHAPALGRHFTSSIYKRVATAPAEE